MPYGMEYSYGIFQWNSYQPLGVLERQLWCCVGAAHSSQHVVCYQHPPRYKCKAQHFQRNVNPTPARAPTWVSVVTSCGTPSSDMCWCVPDKIGGKELGLVWSFGCPCARTNSRYKYEELYFFQRHFPESCMYSLCLQMGVLLFKDILTDILRN